VPEFDWPILRKNFPSEFENPVDPSVGPTDWNPLRVMVMAQKVLVYVGEVKTPALNVRKLGSLDRGQSGLWVGNGAMAISRTCGSLRQNDNQRPCS
jgi:hypothetical protein